MILLTLVSINLVCKSTKATSSIHVDDRLTTVDGWMMDSEDTNLCGGRETVLATSFDNDYSWQLSGQVHSSSRAAAGSFTSPSVLFLPHDRRHTLSYIDC